MTYLVIRLRVSVCILLSMYLQLSNILYWPRLALPTELRRWLTAHWLQLFFFWDNRYLISILTMHTTVLSNFIKISLVSQPENRDNHTEPPSYGAYWLKTVTIQFIKEVKLRIPNTKYFFTFNHKVLETSSAPAFTRDGPPKSLTQETPRHEGWRRAALLWLLPCNL